MSKETVQLLRCLFDNNSSLLLVNGQKGEPIANKRGLLQGSSLSPILFNYFIDAMIETLGKHTKLTSHKVKTNNLFFADDAALHTSNEQEMQLLLKVAED